MSLTLLCPPYEISPASLRAKRSNPDCLRGRILDCFASLAMTKRKNAGAVSRSGVWLDRSKAYAALKPATAFTSRKSSRPNLPHSRPLPDCL
ncbi:hypothetical protein DCG74_16430 [Bradyrhizobium sp. WBAH42]|nr:hypothetical protein DAA51_16685 [Bradyrhizobium sp. WBAH10]QCJ82612.1 hypothetical protein DAA53_16810 [Bradyrhizobium sp. WBAH23]QCJ89979.1 hypothetical protein DAA57_16875 [Bradyrhizobium yuanmingense]QCJ97363.1 hypothetical protein DAA61_16770 [Bradyrhizobium sp. WBAH33]QCK04731.1 hypothetical protein DAB18_16800 [Bradyrhizobium sp. WBAH41]UUO28746.1 hypothetical protein DCG74_16430 [Bradyrhizobium sp. WBAH42]